MNVKPTKNSLAKQEGADVSLRAGLYLVSTPIGNLRDISLRALDTLSAVDAVACEDTRVTGKLLKAYEISKPLLKYNDHSDAHVREMLLQRIADGQAVALVSDAGTPLVSDPGYKLVLAAQAQGVYISAVPGANAPLTALQLSGLPSDVFSFLGFLPSKTAARTQMLARWRDVPSTLVAFETGPRLVKALTDIHDVFDARMVVVARELTKMYEEVRRGEAQDLIAHYEEAGPPKGEIVLLIAPPQEAHFDDAAVRTLLEEALKTKKTKDAAAHVAGLTGRTRSALYDLALEIAE